MTSFYFFILNTIVGLCLGWVFEFAFKSVTRRRVVMPLLPNVVLYGASTGFASLLYTYLHPSIWIVGLLGAVFTTGIEYLMGAYYIKYRNIRLWDYSNGWIHYRGIVNPIYSLLWLALFLIYYYRILPLLLSTV